MLYNSPSFLAPPPPYESIQAAGIASLIGVTPGKTSVIAPPAEVPAPKEDREGITLSVFESEFQYEGQQSPSTGGFLKFGTASVLGTYQFFAWYKAPLKGSQYIEISPSIRVERDLPVNGVLPDPSLLHLVKGKDSSTSFIFDIFVKDYGSQGASFSGTFSQFNQKAGSTEGAYEPYTWAGAFNDFSTTKVLLPHSAVERPADAEGSCQELRNMTSIAYVSDGHKATEGQDKAQVYGDEMLIRIMLAAIDNQTKEELGYSAGALSAAEQRILDDNRHFFETGAVHLVCEQLANHTPGLDPEIKKNLDAPAHKSKLDSFFKMVAATTPPQSYKGTDGLMHTDPDPVVEYGWDREKDAEKLKLIQGQFSNASMRCYEEAYIVRVPEIIKYLKTPVYWFKASADFLESTIHIEQWKCTIINRSPTLPSAQDEIVSWGHKLAILKHCAGKEGEALDVKTVMNTLQGAALIPITQEALIDPKLVQHITELLEVAALPQAGVAAEHAHAQAVLNQFVGEHSEAEVAVGITNLFNALMHPDGPIYREAYKRGKKVGTVAMLDEVLEKADLAELFEDDPTARLDGILEGADLGELFNETPKFKFGKKELLKIGCSVVKFLCAGAAIRSLMTGEGLNVEEKVALWSSLVSPAISAGKKTMSFTVYLRQKAAATWQWAKWLGNWMNGRMMAFGAVLKQLGKGIADACPKLLKSLAQELVGSLASVLRTCGAIACVCCVISAWNDLHSKEAEKSVEAYRFALAQFIIGFAETAFVVAEIGFAVFGMATAAFACGVFACVLGVVGIVIVIWAYFALRPDPWAQVKSFLDRKAKPLGLC
ncbi:hypothetical protein BOTBODRAFT_31291 [Botryobasidium botryosum FD-172 SS1]|uniref:Uncharacterized protein n=1 Tax=Botryobasidium botryosum (strain FD-172 SS1) TaxID=930990 RepID=A0A067MJB4_BOTB1|nr:hypothetical protein BOTBODRAFT_31291 [Botryobasidium botryosum FD-172 SS1]